MFLKNKKILLGVCGGIAAYKTAFLIRLLVKKGADVKVIVTKAALEFVTPLTLATLSKNPVLENLSNAENGTWNNHVELALWADVLLIAPATANTLAKCAHGLCDNLLIATYLSCKTKTVFAPAMDLDMYNHFSTIQNLEHLKANGNLIIEPENGELASGLIGQGRMAEPENIVEFLEGYFGQEPDFKNKNILISAGPTQEDLDPVRFISNHSTGQMGYEIAKAFQRTGANVHLVSGPVDIKAPENIKLYKVRSAKEMFNQMNDLHKNADIVIFAAAVADYAPKEIAQKKIKKNENEMFVELQKTKDIAATLGIQKQKNQIHVGFALETDHELENAKSKLQRKNFDLIVLNSLQDKGAGFRYNTNKITIIDKANTEMTYELKSKELVAIDIKNAVLQFMKKTFILFFMLGWANFGFAQELNCNVTINTGLMKQTSGSGFDRQYFAEIEKAMSNFINTQRWTSDSFDEREKIKCNLIINLSNSPAQNIFSAQAQLQVIRPVLNSTYETVVLQYVDNDFAFSWAPEDRQMIFNEFNYSTNLTSILSFYSLVAIGIDYDSFSKLGGTPYFDRAFNICNLAGNVQKGSWVASGDTKSRYALIDNIRSPLFTDFREGFYAYHRLGLDDLGENPEKSRKNMLDFMLVLKKTAAQRPNSILINSLFDAKAIEFVNVFSEANKTERSQIYNIGSTLSAKNIDKFRALLK